MCMYTIMCMRERGCVCICMCVCVESENIEWSPALSILMMKPHNTSSRHTCTLAIEHTCSMSFIFFLVSLLSRTCPSYLLVGTLGSQVSLHTPVCVVVGWGGGTLSNVQILSLLNSETLCCMLRCFSELNESLHL